ncbi:MAG: efflux RND transporter permease subunit [Chloroflexi bacterium]|nr:efflux RND transporter permease subunit [Chloroflexota bacterium]MDA1228701.1 efflux RND transporter permease subunit [Chloroflexota bacterium]
MSYFTGLALRRRPVTILMIILIMVMGVFSYNNFQRELFPEIEFPNITIVTIYPDSDPEAVVRDVTEPIEDAISGISGITDIQSTSGENISIILATFEFGEDLDAGESEIENSINGIDFPNGVDDSTVSRINSDTFPAIQLSVLGDTDIPGLQRILDDTIIPRFERVDGVFRVDTLGKVDEQLFVTVNTQRLEELGLSMAQVANAIGLNNTSFPAGNITGEGSSITIRTTYEFGSIEDIRNLTVGFENTSGGPIMGVQTGARPIRVSEIADVEISTANPRTISRTNGKPSLSLVILKDSDANTVDVTEGVLEAVRILEESGELPEHVEMLVLSNDGPAVKESLNSLLLDGAIGFLFAVVVVFLFLINVRPSLMRGVALAVRPTAIIGVSIPLSVLLGIVFLSFTDTTLNFMSLAGLAIAVGRVVDDSIVVLENMYRHIQRGEDRLEAAYEATKEVSAAIVASTLTTVVVFIPLGFIQGLVGEFFSPFALSVSLALIASTIVAITAVPVLGAILLRRDDQAMSGVGPTDPSAENSLILRLYMPALIWSLGHKFATLAIAVFVSIAVSVPLIMFVIPITFFPAGSPEFLTIDVELPTSTSVDRTYIEVAKIEQALEDFEALGFVETYQVTLGATATEFGPNAAGGGFDVAGFFVRLNKDIVPKDIGDQIRARMPVADDLSVTVREISNGPPAGALEINVTGPNFSDISAVSRDLEERLSEIDGIINVASNVSDAKSEVVVKVDPGKAAEFGLTTVAVGQQVNQFIVGRTISEIDLEGVTIDIVLRGDPEDVDDINKIKNLNIDGPMGSTKLGAIARIAIEDGPVTISRFDNERSASISGNIVAEDTQAVGQQVASVIATMPIPPGVQVKSGGIFEQINEGFADVGQAMEIGIVLVYLVMVASLGSVRNPFIIVLSLPLAVVGALLALAITGRTLSLSALMGFLLLIGVVVTNAIVLLTFVEQLRERGYDVYDALLEGGRIRLRPILMTAFTTTFALFPLAAFSTSDSGIIGAELATVVIGGLVSSTFLTLIVVPVVYTLMNVSIPGMFERLGERMRGESSYRPPVSGYQPGND